MQKENEEKKPKSNEYSFQNQQKYTSNLTQSVDEKTFVNKILAWAHR